MESWLTYDLWTCTAPVRAKHAGGMCLGFPHLCLECGVSEWEGFDKAFAETQLAEKQRQAEEQLMDEVPESVQRIVPRGDTVLIHRLPADKKTKGGIVLPEQFQADFFKAEIIAIGPGQYGSTNRQPPDDLHVGDVVIVQDEKPGPGGHISRHLLPVTPDEKSYLLCPAGYVMAIERKD